MLKIFLKECKVYVQQSIGDNLDSFSYLSNINPEQFDKIKPILESARKKTRPRSIDLYDVFCGILYVLTGIKRLIAVDTHAIHITTANITDRGGSLEMFALHKDIFFGWGKRSCRLFCL